MWPDRRLIQLLETENPVIQAPMAGHSTVDMAIAVIEAGGLGSLASAGMSAERLRETLKAFKGRSGGALNVNFFAHQLGPANDPADQEWLARLSPYYEEYGLDEPQSLPSNTIPPFDENMCRLMEEFRPRVVSFHFGLPRLALVKRLRQAGILVMSTATTVGEAQWLAQQGCDIIIAQGLEAGGHRGMFLTQDMNTQVGTLALVPQIVDAVNVPVVAAGGIADGRGIAAAFALGACGVQIGTAYLKTPEATLPPFFEIHAEKDAEPTTVLTKVMSGRPARCLSNRITAELAVHHEKSPAFPKGIAALAPLRGKDENSGGYDFSPHYCGQGYALAQNTSSRDLTKSLADQALQCFGAATGPLSRQEQTS